MAGFRQKQKVRESGEVATVRGEVALYPGWGEEEN